MMVNDFRDLRVWRQAVQLAAETYRLTARLPSSERFGLASQSRRAAVSVAANIAEGYGRQSTRDYVRFLYIARGSLNELHTLLGVSEVVGHTTKEELRTVRELLDHVSRMLTRLIKTLQHRAEQHEPRGSKLPTA